MSAPPLALTVPTGAPPLAVALPAGGGSPLAVTVGAAPALALALDVPGVPVPGPQGEQGPQGETGEQGPAGPGVPESGPAGAILTRPTTAPYAGAWTTTIEHPALTLDGGLL